MQCHLRQDLTVSTYVSHFLKIMRTLIDSNLDLHTFFQQDVLDEWLNCQRAWLYLEPIFSSEDINRQLPVESKRYATMERMWRKIMKNAKENPQV